MLYNSEFSINRPLLLTTSMAKENMYWDDSGNIFRILKNYLQESLILALFITLMVLFC